MTNIILGNILTLSSSIVQQTVCNTLVPKVYKFGLFAHDDLRQSESSSKKTFSDSSLRQAGIIWAEWCKVELQLSLCPM